MTHLQISRSTAVGGVGHACGDKKWVLRPRFGSTNCCVNKEEVHRVTCVACLRLLNQNWIWGVKLQISPSIYRQRAFKLGRNPYGIMPFNFWRRTK